MGQVGLCMFCPLLGHVVRSINFVRMSAGGPFIQQIADTGVSLSDCQLFEDDINKKLSQWMAYYKDHLNVEYFKYAEIAVARLFDLHPLNFQNLSVPGNERFVESGKKNDLVERSQINDKSGFDVKCRNLDRETQRFTFYLDDFDRRNAEEIRFIVYNVSGSDWKVVMHVSNGASFFHAVNK